MRAKAFTLIELLIVVAVLAILAALALPNLLAAQTRSKTSRVLADLSTMRVCAEAYLVDHNRYPRMTWGNPPFNDKYTGFGRVNEPIYGTFGYWVTTPVAYLTKYDFLDPFTRGKDIQMDAILYTYHDFKTAEWLHANGFGYNNLPLDYFREHFGAYVLLSIGPDGDIISGAGGLFEPYDPTNGTISSGNIIRSQKHTDHE